MEEAIETDKFYLSNPFFVPEYPSNELKHLDEIKSENTIAFKTEPDIASNGTETSIIADPVAKGTDFLFSQRLWPRALRIGIPVPKALDGKGPLT